MIDKTDFVKKQMLFYFPSYGDKLSFKNDNIVIKDADNKIKFQVTCYRIFVVFIVGDTTITTGLLSRAKKFGFSLCLMNRNMKIYQFISSRMEGNTFLRRRQYAYNGTELARYITLNKVKNQRYVLASERNKNALTVDAITLIDNYILSLEKDNLELTTILGLEGVAAKVYFSRFFSSVGWQGRKPRIKSDYINATLDIGYTILFNIVDALLNCYGFDEYCGVLHRCFYMRKSLVCDLMEPMRMIIDCAARKAINLRQIKESDFEIHNNSYVLNWKKSSEYTQIFIKAILEYREEIFMYIQGFYRAFMKQKSFCEYPMFEYRR